MTGGFLVNLDSVAQREWADLNPGAMEELPGVLRVGCLLTGHLLLTDAQVLDGILLMRLGPRGLTHCIGDAFSIRARAGTLEESLATFFHPGGDTLRLIEFSSLIGLDREERGRVARTIAAVDAAEYRARCADPASGVVGASRWVLESAGVPAESVDFMAESWRTWIDGDRQGRVKVENMPYGTLDMITQARRKPLQKCLKGPGSREATQRILAAVGESKTRSEIRAVIDGLDLAGDDMVCAMEWLDAVYVRSIAKQYDSIAVELPRSSAEQLSRRRTSDEARLLLDVESIDKLSDVRIATFEIIYDRTRDDAKAWRDFRKERHMRHLASIVDRGTTTDSTIRRERLWSTVRLAFVAVAIQIVQQFEFRFWEKVSLVVLAAILTQIAPVAFRYFFPKGKLSAVIDPID